MRSLIGILSFLLLQSTSQAFTPRALSLSSTTTAPQRVVSTALWSEQEKPKKKGGLEGNLRNKLLAESIAPWRTVRLFLYGALGSGAFVGGFITLTGALAAISGARNDVDLNAEVRSYYV